MLYPATPLEVLAAHVRETRRDMVEVPEAAKLMPVTDELLIETEAVAGEKVNPF
jgi:hypothetical protein